MSPGGPGLWRRVGWFYLRPKAEEEVGAESEEGGAG